jgi:competence protein ComEA
MPTDERPPARPEPVGFREWCVASLRQRIPWLSGVEPRSARARPVQVLVVLVAVALVAGAWLVLRPSPRPDIATLLPRATASGSSARSAATGADATGALASPTNATGPSGATGAVILVHVVGGVASPGVVRVPVGARVLDAVAAAGGATGDADLARVNLAAKLSDGQRVAVPRVGESIPSVVVDSGGGAETIDATGAPATPVDLNNATAAQLDALPGVGPATAAAIIAYRAQHGPFATVDALGDVKGIGPAKLEQLRPLVTV